MKRITLFLLLFCAQQLFAQFTENNIKFWVGEGAKKAYLIVDFNDDFFEETGIMPTSYAWGFRYDAEGLTMEDMIVAIAAAEPKIDAEIPNGFLYSFFYNHHMPSTDEYWSTWSGFDNTDMSMNNGVNGDNLVNGKWYGMSYGFGWSDNGPDISHPSEPVPAYSSQWFHSNQITQWYGEGTNQSIVIIDFGTDTDNTANSYAFGIKYTTTTIDLAAALAVLENQLPDFQVGIDNSTVTSLQLFSHEGSNDNVHEWKIYKGKDLSSWIAQAGTNTVLSPNDWVGLSFGDRLPFTPKDGAALNTKKFTENEFKVYPNPAAENIFIDTEQEIKQVIVYDILGKPLLKTTAKEINIAAFVNGVYIVEIQTLKGKSSQKIIKR